MKNNYEKSEKPGRIIIENSLFCEIDEECIYRKIQGMDRHRTDEYTINENFSLSSVYHGNGGIAMWAYCSNPIGIIKNAVDDLNDKTISLNL
mgnify:CR=1 FL=1